jgi:hypothetical protein
MGNNNMLNDRQAKTCATAATARAILVHAVESLEDVGLITIRNARSIVGEHDLDVFTEASGRHGYGDFIGSRVSESVSQKVFKYLFHSAWIDLGRSRLGTPLHRHTPMTL